LSLVIVEDYFALLESLSVARFFVACMTSGGQEIHDFGQTGVCMTLQIWFVIFKMIALEKVAG
jgi:hypothetical protein